MHLRNHRKPLFTLFSIFTLLCLLLSSCNGEIAPTEETGVRFTDALGREITVSRSPQRVAVLLGSFADIWMLAGGSVCAAPNDAWEDFGLDLKDAVELGGAHSPNTELLLASAPQLVLASASSASNVAMRELLETAGITVAYFDVDDFEDYLHMLGICTDITGRKDLFEQNGTRIAAQINAVKKRYKSEEIPPRERTVLLLRVSSGAVKAKGSRGTVLGEMLSDMGCVNIADSDGTLLEQFSVEAVMRHQPYRIFAVAMGSDTEAATAKLNAMIKENPAWGTLDAVQNGRLHVMEKNLFNLKPNARWGEAYEILYETLTKK